MNFLDARYNFDMFLDLQNDYQITSELSASGDELQKSESSSETIDCT